MSKPEGMYTLNLSVRVEPILSYWKDFILFECLQCRNQVHICSCLVNPNKHCNSKHKDKANANLICFICKQVVKGAHFRNIYFFDQYDRSISIKFTDETADLFFKFTCSQIVTNPVIYSDFINTLQWHSDRIKCDHAFTQTIVVKKQKSHLQFEYIYVSGVFQPTLDDSGYE